MTASYLVRRLSGVTGAVTGLALLFGGCQTTVQPRTSVVCPPGRVAVEVTNVSARAARYTVSVEFLRAEEKERDQYSSDRVEPGATATITDDRPDEAQTCRVTAVQVWDA